MDSGKKIDWHKSRAKKKQKFSNYRPRPGSKLKTETSDDYGSERDILTPIVDIVDSSDDRYDSYYDEKSPETTTDFDYERGADFDVARQAGSGSHFVFSSEKQWEEENFVTNDETSEFFTINLNLVKAGLATIPFYRRMDYDPSMFSRSEIKKMDNLAEQMEKEYQSVLQAYEEGKLKPTSSRKSSAKSVAKSPVPSVSSVGKIQQGKDDKDDALDELLNMTTKNIENIKIEDNANKTKTDDEGDEKSKPSETDQKNEEIVKDSESKKTEDIQQWLDDILE